MPKSKQLTTAEKIIILYLHSEGKTIKHICGKDPCSLENSASAGLPKLLAERVEPRILQENRPNPHMSAQKINDNLKTILTLHPCGILAVIKIATTS